MVAHSLPLFHSLRQELQVTHVLQCHALEILLRVELCSVFLPVNYSLMLQLMGYFFH